MTGKRILAIAIAAIALSAPADALGAAAVHDTSALREGRDLRPGAVAPAAAQLATVSRLGARAEWNRFGTPRSLLPRSGWLAAGLPGSPADAARAFLRRNAALYRLTAADVAGLELVNDSRLSGTGAHVVLFRQRFGGLPAATSGLVGVGITGGRVAYAWSTLGAGGALAGTRRLTAQDAWTRAARSVGVRAKGISVRGSRAGFGQLAVGGLPALQQVREVAVPIPGAAARRAFEVNVVATAGAPQAHTVLVDAETGAVLERVNRLANALAEPRFRYFKNTPELDGSDDDRRITGCFPDAAFGTACTNPADFDVRTTAPASGPDSAPVPWDEGGAGVSTTSGNNADSGLSAASPLSPDASRGIRPISPTREYDFPFTDEWRNRGCDPSNFAGVTLPGNGLGGTDANDINAAITSLFSSHNRMHDWAYALGFTERNYNLQVSNYGRGGAQSDPELGNAQAGSLGGGAPSFEGRDNANQIALQDGVPGISNMYLWQPIGSAFYPPCVDGDFDMSVIGHEYTHAISNRMVGGPDEGLSSNEDGQASAMGESYSDLTAVEYLMEHGYAPSDDENPFAVGAYVTGSKQKGIRNYGMNDSPLNYSDVQGYDGSGMASPHDDGEIWSAVNYDIRQALVARYGAGDAATQLACARGRKPADQCPGNRR